MALAAAATTSIANAQIVVVTTPPPGSQTAIPSAQVEGVVVGVPGPAPLDSVFIRTRYTDGTHCPPISSDGAYNPGVLGWDYAVDWDETLGIGTWEGRCQWLANGTNFMEIYLPGDTFGSPSHTQSVVFQQDAVNIQDVVAGVHPSQRTVDIVRHDGSNGEIQFLVDLINTTLTQTYTVDLEATIKLPDGQVVQLPMGGPGVDADTFTIAPGDFSATAAVNPGLMTYAFDLTQAPFPQPPQEGAYSMQVFVYDGPALLFLDEDVDFWVVDRTGKGYRDVTVGSGLDGVLLAGGSRPAAGAGLTAFDYNNDGIADLFFANTAGSSTFLSIGPNWPFPGGNNYLMRGNGDGTFTDVTVAAGVEGISATSSYGSAWGDYNRDGFNDLLVANRNADMYAYRNDGDGTFTDVSGNSFLGLSGDWSMLARSADYDADGDLDLYTGGYVGLFVSTYQSAGDRNRMFRNDLVEGSMDPAFPDWPLFTDVSSTSGTASLGLTLAAMFADVDRDGNLDLAVHNDFGAFVVGNQLFMGDGAGNFVDNSVASGYDVREFSMGASMADLNGDGWLDSYSASLGRNSLLLSNGDGTFTNTVAGSGAEGDFMVSGPQADGLNLEDNWGVMTWDYDLDQDFDIYVAGSDLWVSYNFPIAELHPDSVFENDGNANFVRRALDLGLGNAARTHSIVAIDVDLDGDLDLVTAAENEGATLMRNDLVTTNHWTRLRPVATRSAPGAFNTKFTVFTPGMSQFAETMTESAHSAMPDNAITFGLASNTSAEVFAEWPRGGSTTYFDVAADKVQLIYETVIEINGTIDASVQVGTMPQVLLLGRPGTIAVGAVGHPLFSGTTPLPGGGSLDIIPFTSAPLLVVAPIGVDGSAVWNLGVIPPAAAGLVFELQMTTLDSLTSVFDAKSGISVLTLTP